MLNGYEPLRLSDFEQHALNCSPFRNRSMRITGIAQSNCMRLNSATMSLRHLFWVYLQSCFKPSKYFQQASGDATREVSILILVVVSITFGFSHASVIMQITVVIVITMYGKKTEFSFSQRFICHLLICPFGIVPVPRHILHGSGPAIHPEPLHSQQRCSFFLSMRDSTNLVAMIDKMPTAATPPKIRSNTIPTLITQSLLTATSLIDLLHFVQVRVTDPSWFFFQVNVLHT